MSRRRVVGLVVAGALALALAYPPFPLPVISFVALAPAVLLLRHLAAAGDARRAFRWGWWYGFAAQGAVLSWMVVALWHFTALAALGYVATVAVLGLWTGGVFWLAVRVRARAPALPLALVLPLLWTAMEWGIGHQGDIAFPWLGIGTSLADAPALIQWADLAGARGVGVWVVWCNVMLVEAALAGRAEWRGAARRVGAVAATIVLAWGYGAWRIPRIPLRQTDVMALIQPNIGFDEKWEAARADSEVGTLLALSRRARALGRPGLIIWPEAALPGYLFQQEGWDSTIARFVREGRTPILTGGLHAEFPGGQLATFNAAFFFDSLGHWRDHPVYRKRALVPVVERVPFVPVSWFRHVPWLGKWSGGFGRGTELPVYAAGVGRFGVIVCYESAFEDLPRRYRAAGADFLVNITNDAWFGRTAAPYQHASHLVLRAIETRMGVARAANDGISEFVDPLGHVRDATGLERQAVVIDRLTTSDVVPLYVRLGDWVGVVAVVGTLALLWIALMPRRGAAAQTKETAA